MNDKFRLFAVTMASLSLTGSWSELSAQQTRPKTNPPVGNSQIQVVQQRPPQAARPPQVTPTINRGGQARVEAPPEQPERKPVSKELEEILQEWESHSSQIKTLRGNHVRTVYNLVFEVEKIATGKFWLETPDKGRIDVIGVKPKSGQKSARLGKSGNPYRLEEDRGEKWICTGQEIIAVNEDEKSFDVMPLPKEVQGKNIVHSPLPFLFGMKVEDALERYDITLKSDSKTSAVLIIEPRMIDDRKNYREAWVILDKSNYLPVAVKLFDPSGNLETVYKFEGIKINERRLLPDWFADKDPIHPELRKQGYKQVVSNSDSDDMPENRNAAPFNPQGPPRTANSSSGQAPSRTNTGATKNR